jgi:DNA polymerase I-like protein with 3'-5' exonuclease and polymerase domains
LLKLPDLTTLDTRRTQVIVDLETHDPVLTTLGPSWIRGQGHIVGYAVGLTDNSEFDAYYPVAHRTGNISGEAREEVERWVKALWRSQVPVVNHNIGYDIGWLWASIGEEPEWSLTRPEGRFWCTQVLAALVDENLQWRSRVVGDQIVSEKLGYHLDGLSQFLAGHSGKAPEKLIAYMREHKLKGKEPRAHMFEYPGDIVTEYGVGDVVATRVLLGELRRRAAKQQLQNIWRVECNALRVLAKMRHRGVRIDVDRAQASLEGMQDESKRRMQLIGSFGVTSAWNAAEIARALRVLGVKTIGKTATKKDNVDADVLSTLHATAERGSSLHILVDQLIAERRWSKAAQFIESILKFQHEGRLYPEWHQLKSDEGGTVSGRLSASKPNPQQMPNLKKFPEGGRRVRSLFLPERGDSFVTVDYDQQEPTWLLHYCYDLPSAKPMIEDFKRGIDTHQSTADKFQAHGVSVDRSAGKALNLGLIYGQGVSLLAEILGVPHAEAAKLRELHAELIPFMREHARRLRRLAGDKGVTRTMLGRVFHYDEWAPKVPFGQKRPATMKTLPLEEARKLIALANEEVAKAREENRDPREEIAIWARIERAWTYVAINREEQGSSADQTKVAMDHIDRQGFPILLQIHDEIATSCPNREAAFRVAKLQANAVKLRVPVRCEVSAGPSWGEVEKIGKVTSD